MNEVTLSSLSHSSVVVRSSRTVNLIVNFFSVIFAKPLTSQPAYTVTQCTITVSLQP